MRSWGWKLLPAQGPPVKCSYPYCDQPAVAVREGNRKRVWYCRKHLRSLVSR